MGQDLCAERQLGHSCNQCPSQLTFSTQSEYTCTGPDPMRKMHRSWKGQSTPCTLGLNAVDTHEPATIQLDGWGKKAGREGGEGRGGGGPEMGPGRQRLQREVERLRQKHISSRNWRSCHCSQACCWVVTAQHLLGISHYDLVRKASSLGCLQHMPLLPCTFLHST